MIRMSLSIRRQPEQVNFIAGMKPDGFVLFFAVYYPIVKRALNINENLRRTRNYIFSRLNSLCKAGVFLG